MNIENITVFTDASFCSQTKCAGGALWARGSEIKFQHAFPVQGALQAHEAEILTACNAIQALLEHPEFNQDLSKGAATRLVVVVDCLAVKDAFEQKQVRMSRPVAAAIQAVLQIRERLGFWLKVNHVKAHSGTDSPRQWVNHWCDRNAKAQMRQMRAALQS